MGHPARVRQRQRRERRAWERSPFLFAQRVAEAGERMKLTIDNLDGKGELDYTAMLDAEAAPKITRKLNQPAVMVAQLVIASGAALTAVAGGHVRLYRDNGELWFTGYLTAAPVLNWAGPGVGGAAWQARLEAKGELWALDRASLSERAKMGGLTAGGMVTALTGEVNSNWSTAAVQDVAMGWAVVVESGELWSATAGEMASCARAVVSAADQALTMTAVGSVTRTLSDAATGFDAGALQLQVTAPLANEITVIGTKEPALYVRDCITANGTETYLAMSRAAFAAKSSVLVEDDFHTMALDATKWVSDFTAPLTFTQGGISCNGAVQLRFRDRVEIGGLTILEQTGISYTSGEGVIGGLYSGGFTPNNCLAGVMINNGAVQPVVNGEILASTGTLTSGMLYEFRTLVFHPEPVRSGQVYSSSVSNGVGARTSQVWFGTTHVVITQRQINPSDASTLSGPQVVIYDGTFVNAPAWGDYVPLWGLNLNCVLGHAEAYDEGAVWVRSAAPGKAWRTRVIGDVTAGAECYLSSKEVHFTAATAPVLNEQVEIFYRGEQLACGRVNSAASVTALTNTEGAGERAMVAHVAMPAPRTSLDCEQAARALLDDLTQAGLTAEYTAWASGIPIGTGSGPTDDVQPGEVWTILAAQWGIAGTVIVREVELTFAGLSDTLASYAIRMANEAAETIAFKFNKSKHNGLITVVTSALTDNVATRPPGLPDARIATWGTTTLSMDMGTAPITGGGFEVRVEGDWGWGMTLNQNLVGRYTSQTFTLPNTGVAQSFYLRQYDASTPPQYSPYTTVISVDQ